MSETKEKYYLIDLSSEYVEAHETKEKALASLNSWITNPDEDTRKGTILGLGNGDIFITMTVPLELEPVKFDFKRKE